MVKYEYMLHYLIIMNVVANCSGVQQVSAVTALLVLSSLLLETLFKVFVYGLFAYFKYSKYLVQFIIMLLFGVGVYCETMINQ